MKRLALFGSLAVMTLLGSRADAGGSFDTLVNVNLSTRSAMGGIGSVHNNPPSLAQIGCHVSYSTTSGYTTDCFAYDGVSNYLYCSSSDGYFAWMMPALNGDSVLQFWVDANNNCTQIKVYNGSTAAHKL